MASRFIPIRRGLMQFPKNTSPVEGLQKGDMYLDDKTGQPMFVQGDPLDSEDMGTPSPLATIDEVAQMIAATGGLGADKLITGRLVIIDKDNPNATDARAGLSKYSTIYPFKTIQAAISAYTSFDTFIIRRASTFYTENISLTATGTFNLIIFGATIDGGANTALNLTFASGSINICFLNGGNINNVGSTGDIENTACIRLGGAANTIIYSYGISTGGNLVGNISSANSYGIKAEVATTVVLTTINIFGRPTFSNRINITCNTCRIGGTGFIINSTSGSITFDTCNMSSSSATQPIIQINGSNVAMRLINSTLATGNAFDIVSFTSTNGGSIAIRACRLRNQAATGTSNAVRITIAATTNVEVTDNVLTSRLGKAVEVIGTGTGLALIAKNIINNAVVISMPVVCDPIINNTLTTDTTGVFPLS